MSRFRTDLLRVLAVTYVVMNHSTWNSFVLVGRPDAPFGSWIFAVLNQLGKPSVLLFLFLSGFAFGVHPRWGRPENTNLQTFSLGFYRNRALRIIPPYVFMSLIGFAVVTVRAALAGKLPLAGGVLETTGTLALDFLIGLLDGRHMFHLYFVALLCYLYVLFPLIVHQARSQSTRLPGVPAMIALALPALVVYLFVDPHNQYYQSRIPFVAPAAVAVQNNTPPHLIGWLIYFSYALPFFFGGVRAGQYSAARASGLIAPASPSFVTRQLRKIPGNQNNLVTCVALAACAFALVFNDFLFHVLSTGQFPDPAGRIWRPWVALYAVAAVLLMWNRADEAAAPETAFSKRMRGLARLSFLVYLTHPVLQLVFSGLPFGWRVPLIMGLAWPFAMIFSALAQRYRFAAFLFGEGDRTFTETKPESAPLRPLLSTASIK